MEVVGHRSVDVREPRPDPDQGGGAAGLVFMQSRAQRQALYDQYLAVGPAAAQSRRVGAYASAYVEFQPAAYQGAGSVYNGRGRKVLDGSGRRGHQSKLAMARPWK